MLNATHNHVCRLREVDKQGTGEDDMQIPFRIVQNLTLCSAQCQKLTGENHAKGRDNNPKEQIHGNQIAHDLVNGILVLLADGAGQDRGRANANQCGHAGVDQGEGRGNGNRPHRNLVDKLSDKNPVHEVVQSNDHHADNSGDTQREHELKW